MKYKDYISVICIISIVGSQSQHLGTSVQFESRPDSCRPYNSINTSDSTNLLTNGVTAWLDIKRTDLGQWYWLDDKFYANRISAPEWHRPGMDCAVLRAFDKLTDDTYCNSTYNYYMCHFDGSAPVCLPGHYKCFTFSSGTFQRTYYVISKKGNWYQALQECDSKGHTLAVIPEEHRTAILKKLAQQMGHYADVWFGLRKKQYQRPNDARTLFIRTYNWGSSVCSCPEKDCVIVEKIGNRIQWKQEQCSATHPHICQGDGVVITPIPGTSGKAVINPDVETKTSSIVLEQTTMPAVLSGSTTKGSHKEKYNRISAGIIVAIVIVILLLLLISFIVIVFIFFRRKKNQMSQQYGTASPDIEKNIGFSQMKTKDGLEYKAVPNVEFIPKEKIDMDVKENMQSSETTTCKDRKKYHDVPQNDEKEIKFNHEATVDIHPNAKNQHVVKSDISLTDKTQHQGQSLEDTIKRLSQFLFDNRNDIVDKDLKTTLLDRFLYYIVPDADPQKHLGEKISNIQDIENHLIKWKANQKSEEKAKKLHELIKDPPVDFFGLYEAVYGNPRQTLMKQNEKGKKEPDRNIRNDRGISDLSNSKGKDQVVVEPTGPNTRQSVPKQPGSEQQAQAGRGREEKHPPKEVRKQMQHHTDSNRSGQHVKKAKWQCQTWEDTKNKLSQCLIENKFVIVDDGSGWNTTLLDNFLVYIMPDLNEAEIRHPGNKFNTSQQIGGQIDKWKNEQASEEKAKKELHEILEDPNVNYYGLYEAVYDQ